ncbi:dephospho-CoA kinase [Curtobacterium ammoniigenes]|uniref:dephospho-CoA kinase n=1 Tax=Curtobacterium ammoniigenes TaxID=395387 RepID=UPI0008316019|nr:dephospho-CoA kinase [Curtobacterium ammoniigenes]
MRIIGLTGGIAAGKSTVARRWAEHGGHIVDADQLAREAVAPGSPGLERIRERFGPSVIRPDGSLDRAALGSIVFTDPEARAALNAITHPEVWRLATAAFAAIEAQDPTATAVYDVPLLAEAAADRPLHFDTVVVVHAPSAVRIERLVTDRGMDRDEAERRIGAQASDAERLALADHVVDATGSLDDTIASADDVWAAITGGGPRTHGEPPDSAG